MVVNFLLMQQQMQSILFPYTTLFRSLLFHHTYRSNAAIGGDFLSIFPVSETAAGVFLCDVMGHGRSEEHTSELQSRREFVCRLLLEKKKLSITSQMNDS